MLAASAAGAHPQHTAIGDRYVKLVAADGVLRVVYNLSYGPIGAARARQAMDTNHDARLTAAETRHGAVALGARLTRKARLSIDGERAPLLWQTPFVGPATGPVDTSPLTIELSTTVPLPPGESLVRFEDLPELDGVERSEYAFESTPASALLAAGEGGSPAGMENHLQFLDRRGGRARVLSARIRMPGSARTWWMLPAGAALALLILGVGVWAVRRRRVSGRRTGT